MSQIPEIEHTLMKAMFILVSALTIYNLILLGKQRANVGQVWVTCIYDTDVQKCNDEDISTLKWASL